jgi:hypothetical protein
MSQAFLSRRSAQSIPRPPRIASPAVTPTRANRTAAVAFAGILIAAATLRFATLDLQSFWVDEGATVHLLRSDFGGMLDGPHRHREDATALLPPRLAVDAPARAPARPASGRSRR